MAAATALNMQTHFTEKTRKHTVPRSQPNVNKSCRLNLRMQWYLAHTPARITNFYAFSKSCQWMGSCARASLYSIDGIHVVVDSIAAALVCLRPHAPVRIQWPYTVSSKASSSSSSWGYYMNKFWFYTFAVLHMNHVSNVMPYTRRVQVCFSCKLFHVLLFLSKLIYLHGEFWIWSYGEKKKMTMVHTRLALPNVFADGCAMCIEWCMQGVDYSEWIENYKHVLAIIRKQNEVIASVTRVDSQCMPGCNRIDTGSFEDDNKYVKNWSIDHRIFSMKFNNFQILRLWILIIAICFY